MSAAVPRSSADDLALVLTQLDGPEPLAAACALARVDVDALPTDVGAVAVVRDASADGLARAAGAISQMIKGVPVVALARSAGQITATRWLDGASQGDLPPGLVLDEAPAVLEDIMLGEIAPSDAPGFVSSAGLGRWKAARMLARAARGARRA